MAAYDGAIRINTKIDTAGVKTGMSTLTGSLKKFAAMVGVAFGIGAIVQFGKACIEVASDLNEVQNVVDTTFGNSASKIEEFASTAAEQFGLSTLAAKQYTGTMGAMLKSMGLTEDAASDMSIQMAGLAGDMASFYNLTTDEAFQKIRSGISGETEPLKQLGVNLSVANLEAYALAQGITTSYDAMTEQNKALLRYNYLLDVTADAQGDFAKTSDSWANQVRILQLNFETLKGTLGQAFINVLTPVLQMVNHIISGLNSAAIAFASFISTVTGSAQNVTTATTQAAEATTDLADSTTEAGTAAEKASGKLANFDDLSVLGTDTSGTGTATAGAAETATEASTISDTIDSGIDESENKLTSFFDGYQKEIQRVKDGWENIKTTAIGIWDEISAQFAETDIVGSAFETLMNFIYAVEAEINLFIGIVGDLFVAFNIPETVESALDFLSTWFQAIGDIVSAVTPGIVEFVDTALVPIAEWVGEKLRDAFSFLAGELSKVGNWFLDHKDQLKQFGEIAGEAAAFVWDLIEPLLDAVWESFKKLIDDIVIALGNFGDWCLENKGVLEVLATVVGSVAAAWALVNVAIGIWNVVGAIATGITAAFGAAVAVLTSPVTLVILAIGALIAIIVLLVKHWDTVKEVAAKVWDGIKSVWNAVASWFTQWVIDPIVNAFVAFRDTVVGIWDAIWSTIKGVINSILGGVESFVNGIVSGINILISGFNKIIDLGEDIADFLGFDASLEIPELSKVSLPRLAQGAVIPPNREFIATLGDQKSGRNLELPENLLRQIVQEESGGANGPIEITVTMPVYLDGKEIYKNQKKVQWIQGKTLVNGVY